MGHAPVMYIIVRYVKGMPANLTNAEQASLNKRQAAKLEKANGNVDKASADVEERKIQISSAKSALEKLNESMKTAKETLRQKTADRNDILEQLRGELESKQKPGKPRDSS